MSQVVDISWQRGCYFVRNPVMLNSITASPSLKLRKLILPHQHCLPAYAFKTAKRAVNSKLIDTAELHSIHNQAEACNGAELGSIPHVQTLRQFPREELSGKVVMVRFDSKLLLQQLQKHNSSSAVAISTIKYLYKSGAKLTLVSSWEAKLDTEILTAESFSEYLSSLLELKVVPVQFNTRQKHSSTQESEILLLENLLQFKEERANCKQFARMLTSGVDIFINDAFFESHKILASTVGISCFGYASIAGFYFEAGLSQLKKITRTSKRPHVAIIGGGNLVDKAAALHLLASICDGLVFVGNMAFQIMNALGLPVPVKLVEHNAIEEALTLVQCMKLKGKAIVLPRDFLCINNLDPQKFETFSARCLFSNDKEKKCWQPVDLGPESLEEITLVLSKCKKILWIGPVKFGTSSPTADGATKLAAILDRLRWQNNSEIIAVGKMACRTLLGSDLTYNVIENASIVWEFLKGRNLPGLMALDRAYPFQIHWEGIYGDPTQPLVVDVGSGNGMFLSRMARKRNDLNFLGLELNGKLVNRCLEDVSQFGIKNGYYIRTNATSTFRSIVSSYPGQLVLVSIQCPNPDFNKQDQRWRMLQRSLVEAIADLLALGGKVYLQSDIEAVAVRMKSEFMKYGKGKLRVMQELGDALIRQGKWLRDNPFGVQSDWEQHVLERGDQMYRLILTKTANDCLK